jgi:D-tyrosyl-tRNA(Tyr) deacylase
MKAVLQRVNFAKLKVNNKLFSEIGNGLVVLIGITHDDDINDIKWLVKKILNLRIFNDDNLVMNRSVIDVYGELLVVSQFTLYAQTKKGNRPSYINAAKGKIAEEIYNSLLSEFKNEHGINPKTGKFGADMKVELENDGPVTIIIDTKNK